jgi:hypothetical protein
MESGTSSDLTLENGPWPFCLLMLLLSAQSSSKFKSKVVRLFCSETKAILIEE